MNGLLLAQTLANYNGGRYLGKHAPGIYRVYLPKVLIFVIHSSQYKQLARLTWLYPAKQYGAVIYGPAHHLKGIIPESAGLPEVTVREEDANILTY